MAATITCPNCGVENPVSDTICFFCRHRLSGEDIAPTVHVAPVKPAPTMHSAPTQAISSQAVPPQTATRLQAQALLKGRYRILRELGEGGMGAVYLAQDSQLGDRQVAIKEMSQRNMSAQEVQLAVETFKREAYMLAGLQHPNLPGIHDYFEESGHWYLVMSYIQGESLELYLAQAPGGRLPLAEVLRIAREVCDVLDYLHSHQPPIIFRDLKPSNIMRAPNGHIYLIDFGIARLFKPGQAKDTTSYGSMGYSPPEQYGRSQTTERSDIYSLGVTLYQLLSGYDPSSSPFRLPPLSTLVPNLPERLARLITRMVELDESKRPASIKEVEQELA